MKTVRHAMIALLLGAVCATALTSQTLGTPAQSEMAALATD